MDSWKPWGGLRSLIPESWNQPLINPAPFTTSSSSLLPSLEHRPCIMSNNERKMRVGISGLSRPIILIEIALRIRYEHLYRDINIIRTQIKWYFSLSSTSHPATLYEILLKILWKMTDTLSKGILSWNDLYCGRFFARREDSFTQDVRHLPEKCRVDSDLFEKVYSRITLLTRLKDCAMYYRVGRCYCQKINLYLKRYNNHEYSFFFCRQNLLYKEKSSSNKNNTSEHQSSF